MKIVTISWIRNEGDILEAFVRHNAAFADLMVVVDHRSDDGSREILNSLKKEGLPLDIRHNDGLVHAQQQVLTEVLHEISVKEGPDWIVPLDGDEFLVGSDGCGIREALENESSKSILKIRSVGYVPSPKDQAGEPHVLRRIKHRRSYENPQWWKVVLPGEIVEAYPELKIDFGNHGAFIGDRSFLEMRNCLDLKLAHFPVRTSDQILKKVLGGWLSFKLNSHHWQNPGATFQWKAIFERVSEKPSFSGKELMDLALEYATTDQWKRLDETFVENPFIDALKTDASNQVELVYDPVFSEAKLLFPVKDSPPIKTLILTAKDLAEEYVKLSNLDRRN